MVDTSRGERLRINVNPWHCFLPKQCFYIFVCLLELLCFYQVSLPFWIDSPYYSHIISSLIDHNLIFFRLDAYRTKWWFSLLCLKMQLDVTFPGLPCSILSLDAMDISGEQHLDVVRTSNLSSVLICVLL